MDPDCGSVSAHSADERFDASFHTNILVNSTGYCQYLPPGIFKSTRYIRWFPFDVQRCDLKFGSWTYGGWSLDLQMIEADINRIHRQRRVGPPLNVFDKNCMHEPKVIQQRLCPLSLLKLQSEDERRVPGRRNERFYDCCKEPYPDVTFTVVMRRRTLYYGLNLLIPCVLISTLALLVFLLPADSGEKISLSITVLLSLTVFMLLVAEIMPTTSNSVPLIDSCDFVELVCLVPEDAPACHNAAKRRRGSLSSLELSVSQGSLQHNPQVNNGNLLYVGFRGRRAESRKVGAGGRAGGAAGGSALETELNQILEEVRYIAGRFRGQDEEETVCSEWKFAAAVIDRLCLVPFSLFTILCTIGILMSAPNFVQAISKDFFS
ncbi:neuronal acetylcholine receptor subunit alpha-7-like [Pelmatolapia mariae]|uniref:neuronal acetylcholine receptor subunit alpha-7-like n=1 Tax=Pelmatolapia mariae TaxID=158779 RepID=UPI002FE63877